MGRKGQQLSPYFVPTREMEERCDRALAEFLSEPASPTGCALSNNEANRPEERD